MEDLGRRSLGRDRPVVQDGGPVRVGRREPQVVQDDHDGVARRRALPADPQDQFLVAQIECGGRLVEEEQRGALAQTLSASFGGTVRFRGHQESGEYVLDLTLSGLQVKVKDGKGTLVADVSAKDRETHKVTAYKGLVVASLDVPAGKLAAKDGVLTLSAVPATLTADGTKAFGGMYEAGTALDKLTLAVSLDDNANLPGGTGGTGGGSATTGGTTGGSGTTGGGTVGGTTGGSGSLASTGSDLPTGALLGAAGAVSAAGAAVFFAAKRRTPSLGDKS